MIPEFTKVGGTEVDEGATWDTLALPDELIEQLKFTAESLRQVELLKKQGFQPSRGMLFYGPPGTGKTQIARTFANESGLPFLAANPADLKAGFLGQAGQKVREKFQQAREKSPCILFIDELDLTAAQRGGPTANTLTDEMVGTMLTELDGVKKNDTTVFLLAATNHRELIDSAILERFLDQIEIPYPDERQRVRILEIMLAKKPLDFDPKPAAAELATIMGPVSGRELYKLVERASQKAMGRALKERHPDKIILSRDDLYTSIPPDKRATTEPAVSEADLQKIWSEIVLKPAVKEAILSKIRLFNQNDEAKPRGLLLYGPPGTGKTEIAKKIKDSTGSYFMELKASDLKAGYIGQSGQAVKALWKTARDHGRTIMFIDECDAVFGKRTSFDSDVAMKEVVGEFIASWGGMDQGQSDNVWVIGATNHKEVIDEAVMSRFGASIEIAPPDAAGRIEILRLQMKALKRDVVVPAFMGEATTGLSGRDLKNVAQDVCAAAGDPKNDITPEMWQAVVTRLRGSRSDAAGKGATWDSLILPEAMLKKFKTTCRALRQVEAIRKQGMAPPKAILLYGKPGTGKTQIARTLAHESGVGFVAADSSDLKAGFVGQSAPKVHELFERARREAPCILFIDEIDAAFPKRGGAQTDQFTTDIVNRALTELSGVRDDDERFIFLLGATNRPEMIDEAILSRFPDKIEVPFPDVEQRARILQVLLAKKPVDFDVAMVSAELAGMTANRSGRDLLSLVENASQSALARALDNDDAKADELRIIMSREDLMSQVPSSPARADGAQTGLPAGA